MYTDVPGVCPGFFIGVKTKGSKIKAEDRERGGVLGEGSKSCLGRGTVH